MNKFIKSLCYLAMSFCTYVYADNLPSPKTVPQHLDGIVAIVNNEVITEKQFNAAFKRAKNQAQFAKATQTNDEQLRHYLLDQFINQKLFLQLAKRENVTISQAALNDAINRIAAQNQFTVDELKNKIKAEGLSFAEYKKIVKENLMIHEAQMKALSNDIQVTPQDVQNWIVDYKKQHAQNKQYHVLDFHVPDAKNKQVNALYLSWKKGVAPKSTLVNDLSWQTEATIPSVFMSALKTMKPGEVSQPIQAPNGYHLLKLVAVKSAAVQVPDKNVIQSMVYEQKLQTASEGLLKKLRENAYIKIS